MNESRRGICVTNNKRIANTIKLLRIIIVDRNSKFGFFKNDTIQATILLYRLKTFKNYSKKKKMFLLKIYLMKKIYFNQDDKNYFDEAYRQSIQNRIVFRNTYKKRYRNICTLSNTYTPTKACSKYNYMKGDFPKLKTSKIYIKSSNTSVFI